MNFLSPLDALIPKSHFHFFADFLVWVTSEAWGSVSLGFWGSRQLSPFLGGGSSQGALSTPRPPSIESPSTQWLYTIGGGVPPLQTEVTIVGNNEIYRWENLVGPFLVHKLLGPRPPPPASNTSLPPPLPWPLPHT